VPRYVDPKDRAPETTINLFIPLAAADVHFCGDLHSPCPPARKPRLFFVSLPPSLSLSLCLSVCLSVWLASSLISSFFPCSFAFCNKKKEKKIKKRKNFPPEIMLLVAARHRGASCYNSAAFRNFTCDDAPLSPFLLSIPPPLSLSLSLSLSLRRSN